MNTAFSSRLPRQRSLRIPLLITVALVGLAALLFATLPPLRRLVANPTDQPPAAGITSVLVRGDAFQNHVFEPAVIRVPVGSTVTWTFADRGPQGIGELDEHNVVGEGFASPVLTEGSWIHTFTEAGTYRYSCTLHAFMDGVVVVGE